MKKIGFLLLCTGFFLSCNKEQDNTLPIQHFIPYYLEGTYTLDALEDRTGMVLSIGEEGLKRVPSPDIQTAGDQARERYLQIAERNGDMTYNRPAYYEWPNRYALADNFQSLSVTSDKNWDADHPAGTPLDDIMEFCAWSYAQFIHSQYYGNEYNSVRGRLDQLNADQMQILDYELYIYLPDLPKIRCLRAPSTEEPHTLTLTITTTAGKVHTPTVTCIPKPYDPETE